jgi:hypothetical protein
MSAEFDGRANKKTENEFVAEELRKSGFPLEIQVADILSENGWSVFPSYLYFDYDDGVHKELDIIAYKVLKGQIDASDYYNVHVELLIECKKREDNTWVFFPRKVTPSPYLQVISRIDSFDVARLCTEGKSELSIYPKQIWTKLKPRKYIPSEFAYQLWSTDATQSAFKSFFEQEKSLSFDPVKLEKKMQKKFNREGERREIHSALGGLAKAAIYRQVQMAEVTQQLLDVTLMEIASGEEPVGQFYFHYFFPVLVFDGKLKVWRKGDVSDATGVMHEVTLRSAEYSATQMLRVVTAGDFKEWLREFGKEAESFASKFSDLKEQIGLLIMSATGQIDDSVEYSE